MKKLLALLLFTPLILSAANMQIQFGAGFNDNTVVTPLDGNTGTTLGDQRKILFQAAANVWGTRIQSDVTIVIAAQFTPLFCQSNSATLGSAGPTSSTANFPSAPLNNTWYPRSLADAVRGVDNHPGLSDISADFNSNIDTGCFNGGTYYYGINSSAPSNSVDLFSTVLHELGHGLGFLSLADVGDGGANPATGEFAQGIPAIFDRFIFDTEVNMSWLNMNDAQRLASMSNDPNLTWNGSNVNNNAANFITQGFSDGLVRLYAPSTIVQGRSISHFSTDASPDLLMEPFLEDLAFKQIDLTPHLFKDLGYTLISLPNLIFANGFE